MNRIATFIASLLLLASVSFSQPATFEGLGNLDGGPPESVARGVSADGSVVVGNGTLPGGTEAFRWEDDVMVGLGDLEGGGFFSAAFAVSADGAVVVGQSWSDNGFEVFRWEADADTMIGLGDLPGGSFLSRANGASADGAVVVGNGNSGTPEGFRWEDGVMEGLGDLEGGGFSSEAFGISADGSVIVGRGRSVDGNEAFRWEGDVMEGLGDLEGGSFSSEALAVSADGSVVVGQGRSADGDEAFHWTEETGMIGLGDLPGGDVEAIAYGVSADGSVVVGEGTTEEGNEAFIWTEEAGMRSLKDVLENDHGLDLTGWTLTRAYGISDDGTTIVGEGTNPDGNPEAWRAVLPAPQVAIADITPESFTFEVEAGGSAGDTLNVGNLGDAALEWMIAEADIGACEAPVDIPWLSVAPDQGATAPEESEPVDVMVDASDVDPDLYEALLCITTNDPNAPTIEISVTMSVEANPPENDDIAGATEIPTDDDTYEGTNVNATLEDGEPEPSCTFQDWTTNFSVWWSFTAPDNGMVTLNTFESTFDTILSLHNASDLSEVACDDDSDGGVQSQIQDAPLTEGETYLIRVAGYDQQSPEQQQGDIVLTTAFQFGVADETSPEAFVEGLGLPHPNPASASAAFTLGVAEAQDVTVEVFDATGRRVQTLYDGALAAGTSETLTLDASALPAGVYVIRATGEAFAETRRVTIVR